MEPSTSDVNFVPNSADCASPLSTVEGVSDPVHRLEKGLVDVTLIVIVFGDGSRFTPPPAVPPSSCTWKVKLAYGDPLALLAGVNLSRPPVISARLMNWLAVTATPLSVRVPTAGSV